MKKQNGFTLLELIAVMGIIVALSSVIISGFSVVNRMLARKSGVEAVVKAIKLARQHACIDGRDTYFYLTDFDSFVICRRGGTIAETKPATIQALDIEYTGDDGFDKGTARYWIFDKYSDLGGATEKFNVDESGGGPTSRTYSGTLIYNLSTGKSAELKVSPWYSAMRGAWAFGISSGDGGNFKATYTDAEGNKLRTIYGWIIYPEQKLPKGYAFMVNGVFTSKASLAGSPQYIMFDPSGNAHGVEDGEPMNIFIKELAKPDGEGIYEIKIDRTGAVTTPNKM